MDDLGYARRRDPGSGLVQPWYTHGALDLVQEWDVADKVVLEWGGGDSSAWWASRCKTLFVVETSDEWCNRIYSLGAINIRVRRVAAEKVTEDGYAKIPAECEPDVICIDGSVRDECLASAIEYYKNRRRQLSIVFDNWQQDYVFICPKSEALMSEFKAHEKLFVQADHTNHEGRPWCTAVWQLPGAR